MKRNSTSNNTSPPSDHLATTQGNDARTLGQQSAPPLNTAGAKAPVGFIDYETLKQRIPVCDRTLRDWIRTGKIPSVKLPGSRRRIFFWPAVEAKILRHQTGGVE